MIDHRDKPVIALMMSLIDAEFHAKQLKPHAPEAAFVHIKDLEDLDKVTASGRPIRLISFCSPHIVSRELLERIRYNAVNFHPGPPERPGYMPAPFALHEKDEDFGATFHKMLPKVDTGSIIDVTRFKIDPHNMTLAEVEMEAYKALLTMVVRHAAGLADIDFNFAPAGIDWTGRKTTRVDLAAIGFVKPAG
ncbi:MAG: formyltransferase family protein [Pseudomonadota bacterium]